LRDEEVVDVDAKLLGIRRIERVLGIDEGGETSELLGFGNHLERQRGLARRLRPEDFDHPSARHATHAQGVIDADGARRDGLDRLDGAFLSEAHDRAFSELLFNLAERQIDGLEFFAVLTFVSFHSHVMRSSGSGAILKACPGESQG